MSENADKLRKMGYEVSVALKGYTDDGYDHEDGTHVGAQSCPTVYSVNGFGIQGLHVNEGDEDSWKRLLHPDAHQLRIDYLRHTDEGDDFSMTDDEIADRNFEVAVKLGDMTQKEADAARKARAEAA